MQSQNIDIAVVGAGIVGICCASYLQQAGLKVLLISRDGPGEGASSGNAGHFATEQVLPLSSPKLMTQIPSMLMDPMGPVAIRWSYLPQIAPWMTRFLWQGRPSTYRRNSEALAALNSKALAAFQPLLKAAKAESLMKIQGSLVVYEQEKAFNANLSTYQLMSEYGVEVEHLSGEEVREKEPSLSERIQAGIHFPATGHTTNPHKLALTLYQHFRESGGQFLNAEVTGIQTEGGHGIIQTNGGDQVVPRIVLATGAWSKPWVKQLTGISVPLDTERGYHLMLKESGDQLSIPVSSGDRKFIMTPMEEGLRLAGTVEFGGLKLPANMKRADMLLQHAKALLPNLTANSGEPWMGFRPSLPDSLPVIDQHGPVTFAFGHQHLGLTQAAITGEIVRDLVMGSPLTVDLAPYRLNRFSDKGNKLIRPTPGKSTEKGV